jgi:poly(3-hydroxybutyrate) depolymerase
MFSSLLLSSVFLSLVPSINSLALRDSDRKCHKPLPDNVELGKSVDLTIDSSSGVSPRKYRIHVPKTYDSSTNVPVIVSFHGRGKNAEFQEKLSQFSNSTYGFEGIVLYPEGVPNAKGTQQFQGDPDSPASINDVKFTLELLDQVEKDYCIDKSRIFAAGKSNGGGFTGLLACDAQATKRIAAFAPVSGAIYLNADQKLPACNPSRHPIPIMEFHGFKDNTIPYAGGINTRGNANSTNIVTYINAWAKRDGFEVNANKTTYLCSGKETVTRHSWDDVVVHYNYTNVYHDWMSSYPNGDTEKALTCKEAEATSIILEWFKKWTL